MQSSILAFDQDIIELPDLSFYADKGSPKMILPKRVRAFARNAAGGLDEQFTATLLTECQHEKDHIRDGYLKCGYNVRGATNDANFTQKMMEVKVK